MQQAPGTLAPVAHRVIVPVPPEAADRVLTTQIGEWWPVESHGVFGPGATVAFRAGSLVETSASGEESVWGTVMDHAAGRWLETTWHPGGTPDEATRLSVRLASVPVAAADGMVEGTEVRLEHSGWERRDDGPEARADYHRGWPVVLERFALLTARSA
ncbi:MAG: hypothetical protein LBE25_10725 [Arthrobacter sp.]|jgi:hypothetical protein|nr:hypothetical protein [Arthrobacter sp.]